MKKLKRVKINSKIKKILIMGLPGSGKSFLASRLARVIGAKWPNADKARKKGLL
jgi:shikimate kinase|tara:strand:+ start:337 stop:498 length:162 start_codon:yes stop_codon:yes gene_type:complete